MKILNCQDIGSFHRFTIQYENISANDPAMITDIPLKTGLVLVNMKNSMPFGSIE